jgi:hypothetical protein
MLTRSNYNNETKRNNYVSVSSFRNIINEDPLIDYLELLNKKDKEINRDTLEVISKNEENIKNNKRKSSFDYIMKNGVDFENNIIKEIKEIMTKNKDNKKIIDLNENINNLDKNKKYLITKDILLSRKSMVILGAILYDDTREIFGYPDLIVSGQFIKKYFCRKDNDNDNDNKNININKKRKLNNNEIKISNIEGNCILDNNIEDLMYYVIDIKSSSLDLISGGKMLSGNKNYNFYKFQTYSYSVCIKTLFENAGLSNNAKVGFLMGRKYKTRIKKEDIYFKSFENLAIIKFDEEFSQHCDNKCKEGKKWIVNDLRYNYSQFSLNPINRIELYPNMKNTFDSQFLSIKKAIAEKNKEITLLYYCGVDKRKKCHEMGIKRIDDKRLNSKILGFENKSHELIINNMIELENSNKKIKLNKKENNYMEWQDEAEYEFFVDFETYNKENNKSSDEDIIYMIGSYYKEEFKCFIIDKKYTIKQQIKIRNKLCQKNNLLKLNCNESNYVLCHDEHELINKFTNYVYSKNINNLGKSLYKNSTRLIHWSIFEKRVFESKINKYYLGNKFKLNWYDLLDVFKFKNSPIIIKGCRSFKLKEVTNKLNEYNLINIKWPGLEDGLLSSFMAKDIYEKNDNKNKNDLIIDITEYNYIDCKSLSCILDYIRNY